MTTDKLNEDWLSWKYFDCLFPNKSMQDSPIHTSLHAHTVKPEVIRFIATKRQNPVELAILCQKDKMKKDKMKDRRNKHIKQAEYNS